MQHAQAEAKRLEHETPDQAAQRQAQNAASHRRRRDATIVVVRARWLYISLSRNYSSQIYEVYSGNTQHSKECKKYIFVRTRVHLLLLQRSLPNFKGFPSTGIYSLQINVKLYHHIGGALPGRPEKYGQLYFVDIREAVVACQRL